jgi:LysR family transcriptional activator of nhaA
MTNWLNYHHLFYFKQVVDNGSIIKASLLLRVGQPAISMQIKMLENHFGKELFERRNKKLILTPTGQVVYDYANKIFNLGSELMNTVQNIESNQIKIRIGIHSSVPKNLISRLTSYIYKKFNSVILIHDGNVAQVTMGIIDHNFDIGIFNHPPIATDKSTFFSKKVLSSPLTFVGAENFTHLKNKPLKLFESAPFILPSITSPTRQTIESFLHQNNIKFNLIGEADDTLVQKNMAISGNGIIPIMKEAILSYVKTNQLYILKEIPEIQEEIWFISGKRNISNPITHKLMNEFKF